MNLAQDRPLFGLIRPMPPGPRRRAELRCRVLEVMAASVARDAPLSPVIAAAALEHRGFARRALSELRDLLDAGVRLGVAVESCNLLAFPQHTVAAVQAAEGTPRFAAALAAAARDDAEIDNRRAAAWTACFYPLLVVAIVGGVAGGILGPTRGRLVEVADSMAIVPPPGLALATAAGRVSGWIGLGAAAILAVVWVVRRIPSLATALAGALRAPWQAMPGVRGAARLGAAARLLRALDPCIRAAVPLHEALRRAAESSGCRATTQSALLAAQRAESGASADDVAAALLVPAGVRARFVLAASRAPDAFADAVRALADECTERYRGALDARTRVFHATTILLVGALVLTQLLGVFAMIEIVRREIPTW